MSSLNRPKYYEETERYVREYERKNGLNREQIERTSENFGKPFESNFPVYSELKKPNIKEYDRFEQPQHHRSTTKFDQHHPKRFEKINNINREAYNTTTSTIKEERYHHQRKIYEENNNPIVVQRYPPESIETDRTYSVPIQTTTTTNPRKHYPTSQYDSNNYAKVPGKIFSEEEYPITTRKQYYPKSPAPRFRETWDRRESPFCGVTDRIIPIQRSTNKYSDGLSTNNSSHQKPTKLHYFGSTPPSLVSNLYAEPEQQQQYCHHPTFKCNYETSSPIIIQQQQQQQQPDSYNRHQCNPTAAADSHNTGVYQYCTNPNCLKNPQNIISTNLHKLPEETVQNQSIGAIRAGSPQTLIGAGDITNTENGFTIKLDVQHFQPKDIKVSLIGNTLSVNGDRIDEDLNNQQTLKRSFSRKYAIPEDIHLGSIKSSVTENGFLIIKGSRRDWKETEIFVQIESEENPKQQQQQNVPILPPKPSNYTFSHNSPNNSIQNSTISSINTTTTAAKPSK